MPSTLKRTPAKPTRKGAKDPLRGEVQAVLTSLERRGTKRTRDGMARYGLPSARLAQGRAVVPPA